MDSSYAWPTPTAGLTEIFAAKAVAKGGVIRRDLRWIDREIGRDRVRAPRSGRAGFIWSRRADSGS